MGVHEAKARNKFGFLRHRKVADKWQEQNRSLRASSNEDEKRNSF